MVFWIYLFPLLILSAIPAYIAQTKGKSFGTWYVYSILLLPIALIHSLVIEKDSAEMEARSLSEGNKKCPYCAELVKREAIICKHCKSELKVEVASVSKPMTQEELEEANQDFKRWLLSSPIAGIGVFFIGVLVLITWGVISGNG
ncbi:hypothetical protein N9W76_04855 [Planktomarina temperata]|jgi:hypothetical protein|nr:hypothetical protein [Planktomarina temperata]